MRFTKMILIMVVFFAFLLLANSAFIIMEGQKGILLRLGRLVKENEAIRVLSPGLHLKMPFIESVRIFDTRLQTLDIKSSRIVTREKKDIMVDYYVKWKMSNLEQYFKSTGGNELKAQTLLEQQLNTALRAQVGKRAMDDLISGGRDDLMGILRDNAEIQAKGLGITVVDVRIKGVELPPSTSNAVYQRMRADMQKIASRHRADGQAAAEAIQADADAKVTILLAKASSDGQTVRAAGQAEAASIYANAFGQSKDFFVFYQSLKSYIASFSNKQDILILDENTAFFNYFKQPLIKEDGVANKN